MVRRLLPLLLLLGGCSSTPDVQLSCGIVSGYLEPPAAEHLYRVVVTHLNDKAVLSRPNFRLSPGVYRFTLAELIDDPRLKVALAARGTKYLDLKVEAGKRYHLAAQLYTDKPYVGNNPDYWQPKVWQEEAVECEPDVQN
ncbi:hypothetical protein JYB88_12570 [Shewanella cyperi]|uniref:Uncharacterized protein n=1 Tax=Shewanella cyperi TaxID=2814292 RepID=A0A974XR60_9GAMM|nr:hypothetical protein JYB88_12570 [Shewanella cyperi]